MIGCTGSVAPDLHFVKHFLELIIIFSACQIKQVDFPDVI